jgi:hypothetical protein
VKLPAAVFSVHAFPLDQYLSTWGQPRKIGEHNSAALNALLEVIVNALLRRPRDASL